MRAAVGLLVLAFSSVAAGADSNPESNLTSSWWSSLFATSGSDQHQHHNKSHSWKAAEPYARAHASRDAILEEIAANRARARQQLDTRKRYLLGSGGAAEWRALVQRIERSCPKALRQTRFNAHDLRQHYNKVLLVMVLAPLPSPTPPAEAGPSSTPSFTPPPAPPPSFTAAACSIARPASSAHSIIFVGLTSNS